MKILISFSSCGLCNDATFQKEIIGSWIIGQQDEYFDTEWFITEYKTDGTALHRQFEDASCETTSLIINGHWTIQDGELINVVLNSAGEFDIPSGTAYRMKSDKCL